MATNLGRTQAMISSAQKKAKGTSKQMMKPGDLFNAAKSGVSKAVGVASGLAKGLVAGFRGKGIVKDAERTANQKIFGAPGVDEGTATKAYKISRGMPLKQANQLYKKTGVKNSLGGDIQAPVKGSFKKGGKVKETGAYKLHKGEQVIPANKVKTTGTFKGKSNKLGGGGRFAQLESKLSGKVKNPGAVAAAIGRKKYGAAKMAKMSAKGRKKS